jgi:DEAD/DEAH box helicase domain-containing protein
MSQLNAISATQAIKDRLLDFCRSDHYVTDPQVDQICQKIWGAPPLDGGLAGHLWVEAAFPPRGSGITMRRFVTEGNVTQRLADLLDGNGAFKMDWELREIQTESVRAARASDGSDSKPAIVVSAGTGAGKTESFLFPMLDELMRNPRKPHAGASAIILYPMNALVSDQVERLTNWLRGQTGLKIFHFTGETPEDHRSANFEGYPEVADCCFRTRQHARGLETDKGKPLKELQRGDQPDVIVTNYSMLEYMLCRPQDAVFFGENLRHIVLDEAHLYTGNLAAEITLLLRRLAIKSGVGSASITHYATSATLVEGEVAEQKAALTRFASRVFSKPESEVTVILGKKAEPLVEQPNNHDPLSCPDMDLQWPTMPGIEEIAGSDQFVVSDQVSWDLWMGALKHLLPGLSTEWEEPREISRFLRRALPSQPVFQHLYHLLYDTRIQPLDNLAASLWGESTEASREATRRLLQAGAIAREEASLTPLLPNRIHWSIRAPSGLFFSFAHEHAPSDDQIYRIGGRPVGYFYSPGYFARPEEDKTHPLLVMRNADDGQWLLTGIEQGAGLTVGLEALPKSKERLESLLERLSFFRLFAVPGSPEATLTFDPLSGKVGELGGVTLHRMVFTEQERRSLRPIGSDSRLQLSVIAEGTLTEMPTYPGNSSCWKPAGGRRLLIFSDSRSEAATLGPSLTGNHERQLFRAVVVEGLRGLGRDDTGEVSEKITQLENTLEIVPEVARAAIQREIDLLKESRDSDTKGLTPDEFAESLKAIVRIAEFFDRTEGERHSVNNWSQQIFERNRAEIRNTLKHRLSQELARKTLWPDLNLESAGFLELVYPNIDSIRPSAEYLGQLANSQTRELLSKNFSSFLAMLLDHVRDLGGITLGDDVIDAEYGIGGGYIGKWISLEKRYKNSLLPLITTRDESLLGNFTRRYLTEAGMTDQAPDDWKTFLEMLFRELYQAVHLGRIDWLEFETRQSDDQDSAVSMRLKFAKLRIRQPQTLFQCEDTGQVWPRSALGHHLRSKRSSLRMMSSDQLLLNPRIARVHREWGDSKIFRIGLWAEEHSAQIGAKENRRLQDLFKSGIRNILSSTTTLELGIDIGGLSGVMMGNIPPSKASYLQRAGRAGRRSDGSSLVISYSRNTPYERKVFEDFGTYLASPLREPSVFLDRKDIIRRHVHSLLFSEFFTQAYGQGTTRGAMEAFGGIGTFTNVPLTSYWPRGEHKPDARERDAQAELDSGFVWGQGSTSLAVSFELYLTAKLEAVDNDLGESLLKLTRNTGLESPTHEDQKALIRTLRDKVHSRVQTWLEDYNRLLAQWRSIPSDADRAHRNLANAIHHQLKQLYATTLIEAFSDSMILPRYGFPIGLSELKVNQGKVPRDQNQPPISAAYRLTRSASQAVREYAPGSKILVGAKIVHSQGILKSWTGDDIPSEGMGLRAWFRWNERTGDFRYQYDRFQPQPDEPQTEITGQGEMLFVKHGFSTAASEPQQYGGSRNRVGTVLSICRPPADQEQTTLFEDFFGVSGVRANLHVGGELLAMNSGDYEQGFAVCTKCGYTMSEVVSRNNNENTGRQGLPKGFDWHSPIHDSNPRSYCWDRSETFILRHLNLAARQVCDYLEIELPHVPGTSTDRRRIANTICQALRLSGSRLLNIDSREMAILRPTSGGLTRISICDSLAGGAGHVRDLTQIAPLWWEKAIAMIQECNVTQATLSLLTADIPTREGLPDICVESALLYLASLGSLRPEPEIGEENKPEDFDFNEVSKHLKK